MPRSAKHAMTFVGLMLLTVVSGVLQGRWSHRWETPADLTDAGEQVRDLPEIFGDWRMIEEEEMPAPVIQILNCAGYVNRTYADSRGNRIGMSLYVGPPGPTSVHTPEVCYSSQNTKPQGDRVPLQIGEHTFWQNTFVPNSVTASPFRVAYSWSPTGARWSAVDMPRVAFGSEKKLYKIQIVANSKGTEKDDPMSEFLTELTKSLQSTLLVDSVESSK